jgi:hypothetical protein
VKNSCYVDSQVIFQENPLFLSCGSSIIVFQKNNFKDLILFSKK